MNRLRCGVCDVMEASKKTIRVLLVDDHAPVRQALRRFLESFEGVEVVGEAGDGRAAVELAKSLMPDIVTMDVEMPVMNGLEATRRIKHVCPGVNVIAFTASCKPGIKKGMMEAGASSFVDKARGVDDLYPVIDGVFRDSA
jgi:DNA-binding NarL/FixJ family response regulator